MLKACTERPLHAYIGMSLLPLALLQMPSGAPALTQARESRAPAPDGAAIRAEMISTAAQIVRASKSLSQIWPGYWPTDQAFIIHAETVGALLISSGAKPSSFEAIADTELPKELKGRAYFHKGTFEAASRPFVIGFPIGDGKTALLANHNPSDASRTISLILHEQFHGYQTTAFKGREAQFVDPLAIKDRVGFAASAEVERSILAAAVSARTAGERRNLLNQYFAVRREREQTMPAEVVKVEQGFERIEGTAQYADMVGRGAVSGGGEAQVLSLLKEQLGRKLAAETGAFSTIWFRSRGYGTGAALTYLISKSGGEGFELKVDGPAAVRVEDKRIVVALDPVAAEANPQPK